MIKRWAPGFTIVELIIVILVIAIITTITIFSYNGIRKSAAERGAQSDLTNVAAEMERAYQKQGAYPTELPSDVASSTPGTTLTLQSSSNSPVYTGLNAVQNGVLLSQICNDLTNEGVGKGVDQGGTERDYIIGCGNWNNNSMQITGWATRVWNTPVTEAQIRNYADTYTTSDTWHKTAQEKAVKGFYTQLANRLKQQGGFFPVTTFWDSWANAGNGGVMLQPLPSNPRVQHTYCVDATIENSSTVWHITQDARLAEGGCQ